MPIPIKKIECVLFDLDGTLLPMDMDRFIAAYFAGLQAKVAPYIPGEDLVKYIWAATEAMQKSLDPGLTNEEVFWRHFRPQTPYSRELLEGEFNAFYAKEFTALANVVQPSPWSAQILNQVLNLGKRIVLATNPIFPSVATQERMRWAGIEIYPWQMITTFENSYYCKPHLPYYQGILHQLDLAPQQCLMVGNDVQEDMVATELGMYTYLVTDCLIDSGPPFYSPHQQGSLQELHAWLAG